MDHSRSASGIGEDGIGIQDDLRCKRSDGKQWRCTAMSMPDKTVCEKHYYQAKKRAANSAMRASLKKAKRKSLGESDVYMESKSDDMDTTLVNAEVEEVDQYLPTSDRSLLVSNNLELPDDLERDGVHYEENHKDTSDGSSNSNDGSDDLDGSGDQACHQCQRNDRVKVFWCLKCDKRGYCGSCISTWYSDIHPEEIERICPACRGICNCKVCMRRDNLIKARIREISVQDKLQYLHCLLSSVLPVIKNIHHQQCFEVELERKLRGNEIDLPRRKLNADEQMCCDCCRMPIIDYHRHCANCSYDLCLRCCQDLREASVTQIAARSDSNKTLLREVTSSKSRLNLSFRFPNWISNINGSIPCPPKEHGGCACLSLTLKRIFKMNWIAKLVKNAEEMVSGCKVNGNGNECLDETGSGSRLCQFACRDYSNDNFLYCPSSEDIRVCGIGDFRKHWAQGKPVIIQEVCDSSSVSSWNPMVIWEGTEKIKDDHRVVKATDCLDWSEVKIELGHFMKGYSEGRIHEDGWPEMLKLKDWPSPSASEDFLLYHQPEFVTKLPLLEYIHSKWGLLNVAAKLPHYSLQNDVGPKILISYGMYEELGKGDSVDKLHFVMRDMVYLLVHTCKIELNGWPRAGEDSSKSEPGAFWDVFRKQDIPKLIEYCRVHSEELGSLEHLTNESEERLLHDGVVYLNMHHKRTLKEEFGVEPWSFEQRLGQAIFIPAGCPFQMRNTQSTVQLALDFLSPESLGEAVKLAEEIRTFPNDHNAKLQMLEVGKISIYAASSAIKEVRKLVLDPRLGSELLFEDPNLTALVSENLEEMVKWRKVTCSSS
ncbi:lysine-specific demethylase JMJ25 isoform X2 [Impatiens glandulifera]|uniref:lysine-specific demethylase JMJ25 isoform X2 n=1 Tax=Impatiens glandulifera TaxID=253017 RepID=UPI001FB13DAF|nr:lysine-specific demethylase JMJ25 isoform X2 [Impatiens glandulifera]